jgi:hypothetical protein
MAGAGFLKVQLLKFSSNFKRHDLMRGPIRRSRDRIAQKIKRD